MDVQEIAQEAVRWIEGWEYSYYERTLTDMADGIDDILLAAVRQDRDFRCGALSWWHRNMLRSRNEPLVAETIRCAQDSDDTDSQAWALRVLDTPCMRGVLVQDDLRWLVRACWLEEGIRLISRFSLDVASMKSAIEALAMQNDNHRSSAWKEMREVTIEFLKAAEAEEQKAVLGKLCGLHEFVPSRALTMNAIAGSLAGTMDARVEPAVRYLRHHCQTLGDPTKSLLDAYLQEMYAPRSGPLFQASCLEFHAAEEKLNALKRARNPFVDPAALVLVRHTNAVWTLDPEAPSDVLEYEPVRRGKPEDLMYHWMHFYIDQRAEGAEGASSRYGEYRITAPYTALQRNGTFSAGDEWRWADPELFAAVYVELFMRQYQIEDRTEWRAFPPGVWGWEVPRREHDVIMHACEGIDWPLYWEDRVIKSKQDVSIDGGWGSLLNGLGEDDRRVSSVFQHACGTLHESFPWWLPAVVAIRPLTQEIVWNADPPGGTVAARRKALLRCVTSFSKMGDDTVHYSLPDSIEAGTDAAYEAYASWWSGSTVRGDSRLEYVAAVRGDSRAPPWASKRVRETG